MLSKGCILETERRKDLIETLLQTIYQNSTITVFFHKAIAEQVGLGATEEKTLLLLSAGALTAGEIAQQTGLTTASVTSLIDRLESKGFVRRVRDANDRRRVIVEADVERLMALQQAFSSIRSEFADLTAPYSDDQLVTIIDFVSRSSEYSQQAIEVLKARKEGRDQADSSP
jgi:DNA-binding MarR family transcriptional regulator